MKPEPRVLIVAEHASLRFGGEAALPLHFFMGLRKRGIECWMIVHARTRSELQVRLGQDFSRLIFIEDDWFHKVMWRMGSVLPAKLAYHTTGLLSRLRTQITARRLAKDMIASAGIDLVHQPIPVSPKEPSLMARLGVPVVMGPMNGNMTYPPGLQKSTEGQFSTQQLLKLVRFLSEWSHHLMPGKTSAALLLVANERTRLGLPKGIRGEVRELFENGVDPDLWNPLTAPRQRPGKSLEVAFMGRLIDLKRVDLVIHALAKLAHLPKIRLTVIGDGPERPRLEAIARSTGVAERVAFEGWREQTEAARLISTADCLILPSIHECGGAVVLEAMSMGLPVVATAWGGPLDYISPETGILVEPISEAFLINGFAQALERLALDPAAARQMGDAGRQRVLDQFTWPAKIDAILGHYRDVMEQKP